MMETGTKTRLKDGEYTLIKMDLGTRVVGRMIGKQDLELRHGQMVRSTLDITTMARSMVEENTDGLMAITTMGTGPTT